ncbi:hypothetical protein AB0C02_19860 [Micromonospora sp. NPDC048999]|uniref:hypothetical protein n=1 Tax=Micromonospora sp. NPDC048999 TaxID=3155391 RepID=UPI0033D9865E
MPELIGWGLSFADGVLFCDPERSYTGRFADAESTLRLLARTNGRLHLIWLDR